MNEYEGECIAGEHVRSTGVDTSPAFFVDTSEENAM